MLLIVLGEYLKCSKHLGKVSMWRTKTVRGDVVYLGCFSLAHAVNEDKAKAKFESGLLKIEVPLKSPIKGKRVKIM